MAPTYTVDRIVDLLMVPANKRRQCIKELLYAVELMDFAEATASGPLTWTDDGDVSCTLYGPDGKAQLSLRITK
jgi:hypothetical protein